MAPETASGVIDVDLLLDQEKDSENEGMVPECHW
jgi:hypothetical protein